MLLAVKPLKQKLKLLLSKHELHLNFIMNK